jgi:serine/threonine-protein kinase HipA
VRLPGGGIAIAKFPSADHDTWNVMAWEKVALDLAGASGIQVPVSQLLRLADRSVLIVNRFDRGPSGERIGYASAMTMLDATDGEQRTYLDIADVIEQTSARATAELHQLWRRLVFAVLISNTDDHLRNHGFLHQRGDVWALAPAFDLNPDPRPGPAYLSTAIEAGEDLASLDATLAVSAAFRLDDRQARHIIDEVSSVVASWRHVAAGHGLMPPEIARMEPAFSITP